MQRRVRAVGIATVGLVVVSVASAAAGGNAPGPNAIYPTPRFEQAQAGSLALSSSAAIVVDAASDPAAVTVVRSALAASGTRRVVVTRNPAHAGSLTVYVGTARVPAGSVPPGGTRGLPAGGYVLAIGRSPGANVIVLEGVDAAGQFYAAQSLRQLLAHRRVLPRLTIRDWPAMRLRGLVEGFYGRPWSTAEQLSMIDFLGAHKLNLYIYAPKDEPTLRAAWRTPLSQSQLGRIHLLDQHARSRHVTFTFSLSPGLSICYSSPSDELVLSQKLAAVWDVGVRSFTVAFDDIDPKRLPCATDRARFGSGPAALARAQASLLDRLKETFVARHPGSLPLIAVPTEYFGLAGSAYQRTFATKLDPGVVVQWTGRYGVSLTIHRHDLDEARAVYRHPVLLWDNHFVNDYARGSLVLGPYTGRDPALAAATLGVTIDPMIQAEASKLGLFTAADYSWNPQGYDPAASAAAGIAEFAGGDDQLVAALAWFTDVNSSSAVNTAAAAPTLAAAIARFWAGWNAGDVSAADPMLETLSEIEAAPAVIRARSRNARFLAETGPWLDATEAWAAAAWNAVHEMVAYRAELHDRVAADDLAARALRAKAQLILSNTAPEPTPVTVSPGVLGDFVHKALRGYGP